jgi:hypothetical protein
MTVIQLSDSIGVDPRRLTRRLSRPPGECLSHVCDRALRCVVIAERRPEVEQRLNLISPVTHRQHMVGMLLGVVQDGVCLEAELLRH